MAFLLPQFFQGILPTCCILCNKRQLQTLCEDCIQELNIHPSRRCIICATPHLTWVCKSCFIKRPFFDETICVADISSRLFIPIQSLRNKHQLRMVKGIVKAWDLVSSCHCTPVDLILPIPLTMQKLHQRGFNQAWEIAKHMGYIKKIPAIPNLIERVEFTQTMPESKSFKERYIKHSLKINRHQLHKIQERYGGLRGKRIALVDDFMNSGATFNALAELLKENGVFWVSNWVILRFPKPELF